MPHLPHKKVMEVNLKSFRKNMYHSYMRTVKTCSVPSIDWPEKIHITRIVNDIPNTQGQMRCDLAFVHMGRHGLLKEHGNVLVRTGTRGVGLHGAQPS